MTDKPTRVETINEARNSVEMLEEELKRASDLLIPLLREYLRDVRTIRMGFAEEVVHIINSSRNLNELVKSTPQLLAYGEAVKKLQEVLTPEFIETIAKLKKE